MQSILDCFRLLELTPDQDAIFYLSDLRDPESTPCAMSKDEVSWSYGNLLYIPLMSGGNAFLDAFQLISHIAKNNTEEKRATDLIVRGDSKIWDNHEAVIHRVPGPIWDKWIPESHKDSAISLDRNEKKFVLVRKGDQYGLTSVDLTSASLLRHPF